MALRGKAQSVDSIGTAVSPLAKLLRRLCEGHVWSDGAVDNSLRSFEADDPVHVPGAVKEVGDGHSMFTRGDPVLLSARVNLKHMGSCAEDRLLSHFILVQKPAADPFSPAAAAALLLLVCDVNLGSWAAASFVLFIQTKLLLCAVSVRHVCCAHGPNPPAAAAQTSVVSYFCRALAAAVLARNPRTVYSH